MTRIGVLANRGKASAPEALARLSRKAASLGLKIVCCEESAELIPGAERTTCEEFPSRIDVLVALGGDGTMLRAVRMLAGADKPVLGVNLGSLGFMTSVTKDDIERALEVVASGEFTTSTRAVVSCRLIREGETAGLCRALNDVVIGWGSSSRVNVLEVKIDDEQVASYMGDGLIISTPTGSTGHSLSAGGPILHPSAQVFVISAICPHTLSNRPLVVPDSVTISIRVARAVKRLLLSVDGQEEQVIHHEDVLEVKRSGESARFVHLPGYSYFSVLRQKLCWRGSSVEHH